MDNASLLIITLLMFYGIYYYIRNIKNKIRSLKESIDKK